MQKYLLLLALLFCFHLSQAHRVGFSNEKWLIKKTKHFDIHHSAEQQDLGLYYSKIAETAYENLSKVFAQSPEKITIVLNDSTDNSNGYATVIPYPLIMVYPVQVSNQDSLSEAGEWSRELLTHEMTHIFQMFPYRGFYNWLRPIYGTIVSPNLLTPSWWKEGMSIEMETQFSPQGRSRSNLQNATIRSLVIDDKLSKFTLAEANETLKTWPYGNRPYFLGSMMMSEIANDGGLSAISQIVDIQSGRIPYFIESPMKETTSRSYQNEFYQMIENQTKQAQVQIQKLNTVPVNTSSSIDENLLSSRHPRFQETTKTLGLIGLKKSGPEIIFYKWNEAEKKYLTSNQQKAISGSIGTFEFHPKNPAIVFSKVKFVNTRQEFSDLYIYDLTTQIEKKITSNERAREPVYSDDGSEILFITTANGQTEARTFNVATEKIESLYKTGFESRITQIIDLNSSAYLLNVRDPNGDQNLYLLNKKTKDLQSITTSHNQIRFIKKHGARIYWTSTDNGVSNIYSSELTKNIFKNSKAETHLMTGALSFDVTNDKFFSTIIGAGTKVQELQFRTDSDVRLPVIENQIAARYKFTASTLQNPETTDENYSVWPKILPHYWIPFLSTSSSNKGIFAQIQTAGQDPLSFHSYQASVNYDSYLQKGGFNFTYLNSVYDWQIAAAALQTQRLYGTTTITTLQKNSYTLGLLPDIFKISENLILNLGAVYNKIDDDFLVTEHAGGYLQTSYKTFEQKVFQYYPMSGWGTSLRYENLKAQKDLDISLGDYSQILGSMTGYFSAQNFLKWLPEDHSLMFKVDGLYTFEDVSSRFGTSNSQFPLATDGLTPQFAARGYKAGQFFGSQLFTTTAEYRFPIREINGGSGTNAFFIKTLTGAIVADGIAVKGFGINDSDMLTRLKLSDQFWSLGAEARVSTTLGYFLPLQFVFGYYLPFSPAYGGKYAQMGLSLQLGGF
jgi:hypothetical protein